MTSADYTYRPARSTDLRYIVSCWVRCDSRTMRARECIRVHGPEHGKLVVRLMGNHDVTARVAALPDDDDAIMGFAVYETGPVPCLHFVYVRKELRGQGVAKRLLEELAGCKDLEISHKPGRDPDEEPHVLPAEWIFNPYRAYRAARTVSA